MVSLLSYLENGWGAQTLDDNSFTLWLSGYGVVEGVNNECDVVVNTGTYGASDTLTVQAGDVLVNGTRHSVSSTDVTIDSPSSEDRKDLVYIDNTGTPSVAKGSPASPGVRPQNTLGRDTYEPKVPDLSNTVGTPLKEVYVASGSGSVASSDLTERRWYSTIQVEEADIRLLTANLDAQNNEVQNATLAGANLSLGAALDADTNDISNVGTLGAATVNPTNLGATTLTGNLDASSNQVQNAVLAGGSLADNFNAASNQVQNAVLAGGSLADAFDASTNDIQNVAALDTDTLDVQNETLVHAPANDQTNVTGTGETMSFGTPLVDDRSEFSSSSFSPDNTDWYHNDINMYFTDTGSDTNFNHIVALINETDDTEVARSTYANTATDQTVILSGIFELDSTKSYNIDVFSDGISDVTGSESYWTIRSAF